MRRRDPSGYPHTPALGRADEIERAAGRYLPQVQPRPRHFCKRNVARGGECFGFGRRGGQTEPQWGSTAWVDT